MMKYLGFFLKYKKVLRKEVVWCVGGWSRVSRRVVVGRFLGSGEDGVLF